MSDITCGTPEKPSVRSQKLNCNHTSADNQYQLNLGFQIGRENYTIASWKNSYF